MSTPPDVRNALAEIVAGLDGVTPGPWVLDGNPDRAYFVYTDDVTGSLLARLGGSGFEFVRRSSAEIVATTAHFSRLDPATIRSIADYVAALEAQVEGMRWTAVPNEPTLEFLKSINIDNQVLAYENGRYYNAWFEFEQSEGGWFWTDDADSEPNPSHYCRLPAPPARAALQSSETTGEK